MALEEVFIIWSSFNFGLHSDETECAEVNSQVVKAAQGRVPVFLDGGVRRGTDVFKALALGASGIFVSFT